MRVYFQSLEGQKGNSGVVRQDPIAADSCRQFRRESLEVGEQPKAHVEQQADDEQLGHSKENGGLGHAAKRFHRQESLHGDLVGAVIVHNLEEIGNEHSDSGHFREAESPVDDAHVIRRPSDLPYGSQAPGDRSRQAEGHPHRSPNQDQKLHDICP